MTSQPTFARVDSFAHWRKFFHPTQGVFRLPNTLGSSIIHLDIDLRFVDHDHDQDRANDAEFSMTPHATAEVYLPNVQILTLRGAEHCHDVDERMDELADVLLAIKPIEVRWLNATSDPAEQLTFSTHLVHPAIIAAGEIWARTGAAQKIVMQGGFPCPNLSAPTPFSLTPAATPCHSPYPAKMSFGSPALAMTSSCASPATLAMPAFTISKSKTAEDTKAKERAERKRLANYTLKPRFDFAFGSWGSENIEWRFDGRYSPACILASIEYMLLALNKSFPYASIKAASALPSLLSLAPIPLSIVHALRGSVQKLDLDEDLVVYLADIMFVASKDESAFASVFEGLSEDTEGADKERSARRLKAEMLLLHSKNTTPIPLCEMLGEPLTSPHLSDSMSSVESIVPDDTDATTEDGDEAVTPEMVTAQLPLVTASSKGGSDTVSTSTSRIAI